MALKYDFVVRSIALRDQSIVEKHELFISRLAGLSAPWGVETQCPAPDPGTELSAIITWARLFASSKGIGGHIIYQFRQEFRDEAFHDDKIMLSFNPARINYRGLIDLAMPRYVEAFDGYFAEMTDQKFLDADWDGRPPGYDPRHHLYRLPPVSYMRRDFCARALGLSPSEVVNRMQGHVAVAKEMLDGVVIVLTYDILPTEEMDRLCWLAKGHLIG